MLSALSLSRHRKSLVLSGLATSMDSAGLKSVRFSIPHENDEKKLSKKHHQVKRSRTKQQQQQQQQQQTTVYRSRTKGSHSEECTALIEHQHQQHQQKQQQQQQQQQQLMDNRIANEDEEFNDNYHFNTNNGHIGMGVAALDLNRKPNHIKITMDNRDKKSSPENDATNVVVATPRTSSKVGKPPHFVFATKPSKRRRWLPWNPCRPQTIVRFLLEDWLFLAVLGVIMAFLSLAVDSCIDQLQTFHMYFMNKVERADDDFLNFVLTYIVWVAYTMVVMLTSVIFVHYVGPAAIGSGIPEMKTILRGVRLKECLSFRTLLAKMVGLAFAIGSGFPIGKEGPFVHVGSIVANLISRLVRNFKPAYANESRSCEMLAAGCAAGVACTFSAPVGGVLFSIEVTAVYFAVRDYWRGFFAAACGSAIFSLLRLYTHTSEVTVVAFYQTTFKNRAFYPEELFIFALIGLFCGITGAIFICIHRHLVLFLRRNSFMKIIFQRNWIVYPIVISALYATLTHPFGFGRYITGEVVFSRTLKDFFMNCTWSADPSRFEACTGSVTARWSADESIFAELTIFVIGFYFLSIVASTLPVPAGIFMPVFVIGAGMGRLFGEIVAHNFPDGLRGDRHMLVYPGIYAVVGASSFCGAVTHTVSVAVIAFELTGQLLHILPVMIAVIIANITCSSFQPSFFDSIIKIKHLPYLPDIPKSTSEVHSIRAEQIMVTNVKFLSKRSTYGEMQDLLISMPRLRAFPVVNNPESKILLGSISRATLLQLLDSQVGEAARRAEAAKRAETERDVLAKMQQSRKKPIFGIEKPDIARKTAVENFLADYSKPTGLDRFRMLPVYVFNRPTALLDRSQSSKDYGRRRRSASENTRKVCNADQMNTGVVRLRRAASSRETESTDTINRNKLLRMHSTNDLYNTLGGMLRNFSNPFRNSKKRCRFNNDLMANERREWERKQLACVINFASAIVDPAPFQLVEDTSLYKVHSIFSLLGIRRAYVTKCGVLVGVVALRDLRSAIERTQWGDLNSRTERANDTTELITVDTECRSSSHTDMQHTDNDSDTDDDDCILPRVEVDETTPSTCELEQKLPMTRMSSEGSDQCVTDETDLSASSPTSPVPSPSGLPLKLQSYLDVYCSQGANNKEQSSALPSCSKTQNRLRIPKSARHVLIIPPDDKLNERIYAKAEEFDDDVATSSSKALQPSNASTDHEKMRRIVPCDSNAHSDQKQSANGKELASCDRSNQNILSEHCAVWIDDNDDGDDDDGKTKVNSEIYRDFSPSPSDNASDECSTSSASKSFSYPPQPSPSGLTTTTAATTTTVLDEESKTPSVDLDWLVAYRASQRSISDVAATQRMLQRSTLTSTHPMRSLSQAPKLSSRAKTLQQIQRKPPDDDPLV